MVFVSLGAEVTMKRNLLVMGEPGVGKSTLVRTILDRLSCSIGGILTEEMLLDEERVGFKLRSLTDGNEHTLAHRDHPGPLRVGRYCVELGTVRHIAIPAIQEAIASRELIVIDEIARMQLVSRPFSDVVLEAIRSPKPVLGTVHSRSHVFTDKLKQRPDVLLIELTQENRDEMLELVLEQLGLLLRNPA